MAIPLRDVATGPAVLHGWHLPVRSTGEPHPVEEFRPLGRDL